MRIQKLFSVVSVVASLAGLAVVSGCLADASEAVESGSASAVTSAARTRAPFARGEGSDTIVSALKGGTFAGDPNEGDGDGTIFASLVLGADGKFTAKAGRPAEFFDNAESRYDETGRWGIEAFRTGDQQQFLRHRLVLNTSRHNVISFDFNEEPAADGSGFVLNDQPVQQKFDRIFLF